MHRCPVFAVLVFYIWHRDVGICGFLFTFFLNYLIAINTMIQEKRNMFIIVILNCFLQQQKITPLIQMLFSFILLNYFSTYFAFRLISIALHRMCRYLRCWHLLLTIWTIHYLIIYVVAGWHTNSSKVLLNLVQNLCSLRSFKWYIVLCICLFHLTFTLTQRRQYLFDFLFLFPLF